MNRLSHFGYSGPAWSPQRGPGPQEWRSFSMWLKGFLTLAAFFVMAKNESRAERGAAIVELSAIAVDFDIEPIAKRS